MMYNKNIDIKYKIIITILVTSSLSVILRLLVPKLPSNSDIISWKNFTHDIDSSSSNINMIWITLMLMTLHASHLFLCVPFMFVTKMLYGHFLGFLLGSTICILSELSMVSMYIFVCSNEVNSEQKIHYTRYPINQLCLKYGIYTTIACAQISSMPISCTDILYVSGVVTKYQFHITHICVTIGTSLKDIYMGLLLHTIGHANTNAIVFMCIFILSTLIPVTLSFFLFSGIMYNLNIHDGKYNEDLKEDDETSITALIEMDANLKSNDCVDANEYSTLFNQLPVSGITYKSNIDDGNNNENSKEDIEINITAPTDAEVTLKSRAKTLSNIANQIPVENEVVVTEN